MPQTDTKAAESKKTDGSTKATRIYWIHTLTPLHVGAGRGVGFIDLPIQREKITNWPIVPGSAVKGVLADAHGATEAKRKDDPLIRAAFGRADATGDEGSNSGALVLTDARIVCLPVRSFRGTFAWVTCPDALERLKRDMVAAGVSAPAAMPAPVETAAKVPSEPGSALIETITDNGVTSNKVYFEDIDLDAETDPATTEWAETLAPMIFPPVPPDNIPWQGLFKSRFAVVHSDVFNFLCDTGTEVNAHVRIDDKQKTVAKGALWYEECLPAEAILAGIVWCDRVFGGNGGSTTPAAIIKEYASREHSLQIGGKATVGKGRVRCIFPKEA